MVLCDTLHLYINRDSPLGLCLGKTNAWIKHVHPPVADKEDA